MQPLSLKKWEKSTQSLKKEKKEENNHATFKKTEDKSCNLFKIVLVLLSSSVKRVGVSRMRDFFLFLY